MGRLAVSSSEQGKGHGDYLLAHAVARCLGLREQLGVRVLLVDALHEKAASFYRAYGFREAAANSHTLYLPLGNLWPRSTTSTDANHGVVMSKEVVTLVVLFLTLFLSACGGDSNSGSTGPMASVLPDKMTGCYAVKKGKPADFKVEKEWSLLRRFP